MNQKLFPQAPDTFYPGNLLPGACLLMELSWLCALASFLSVATTNITYPFIISLCAYFMGLFSAPLSH